MAKEEEDSGSDLDSEEEEWPVAPIASNGSFGLRGGKGKGKGKQVAFTVGEKSEVEKWNDETRAQSWVSRSSLHSLLSLFSTRD